MLEILEFIFQDFYHWFGTLILLAVLVDGVGRMFGRKIDDKEE